MKTMSGEFILGLAEKTRRLLLIEIVELAFASRIEAGNEFLSRRLPFPAPPLVIKSMNYDLVPSRSQFVQPVRKARRA